MQFEKLKSLTIVNSEGMTVDYEEGILPILQVIGPTLENLILNKFESVNLVSKFHEIKKEYHKRIYSLGE